MEKRYPGGEQHDGAREPQPWAVDQGGQPVAPGPVARVVVVLGEHHEFLGIDVPGGGAVAAATVNGVLALGDEGGGHPPGQLVDSSEVPVVADALAGQQRVHGVVEVVVPPNVHPEASRRLRADDLRVAVGALGHQHQPTSEHGRGVVSRRPPPGPAPPRRETASPGRSPRSTGGPRRTPKDRAPRRAAGTRPGRPPPERPPATDSGHRARGPRPLPGGSRRTLARTGAGGRRPHREAVTSVVEKNRPEGGQPRRGRRRAPPERPVPGHGRDRGASRRKPSGGTVRVSARGRPCHGTGWASIPPMFPTPPPP